MVIGVVILEHSRQAQIARKTAVVKAKTGL